MRPKLNLDKKTLLENEFSRSLHGYSPEEVDKFLDLIIADYDQYEKEVEALTRSVFALKGELEAKKSELEGMSVMYKELKDRTPNESQLSLLQKSGDLNALTKEVQRLTEAFNSLNAQKQKKD